MYYIVKTTPKENRYYFGGLPINLATHFTQREYIKYKSVFEHSFYKFIRINNDGTKTEMA